VKFTSVITKIDFDLEDVRVALADYVDLNYNKPQLAARIRKNQFKVVDSPNGKFSIKLKGPIN